MTPANPHPDRIPDSAKSLHQMNSLRDMGHFPVLVHAGATVNVLITVAATRLVFSSFGLEPLALPLWTGLVLFLNLMPVLLLRAVHWRAGEPMPTVEQMNFFGDQHRFADWVYVAASANMAFWIALSWCAYTLSPGGWTLPAMLILALFCTFAPVWLRLFR
jgi:hypothetical protein